MTFKSNGFALMACAIAILISAPASPLRAQPADTAPNAPIAPKRGATKAAATIIGSYYNEDREAFCTSTICDVNFSNPPSGKTLVITHVSCHVEVNKAALIESIELARFWKYSNGGAWYWGDYLAPINKTSQDTTKAYYSVATSVLWPVPAAQNPFVEMRLLSTPTTGYMACNISGTIY